MNAIKTSSTARCTVRTLLRSGCNRPTPIATRGNQAISHAGQKHARHYSDDSATSSSSSGKVVFSGIQPTGSPHLGNYFGTLKEWVKMQNNAAPNDELFFSIVGLHALTGHFQPDNLRQGRRNMMATLLAIGLDPSRVTLFHQDEVPEHAELSWYLTCLTPVARLRRQTAWKSKFLQMQGIGTANDTSIPLEEDHLLMGLLAYPILQSADILLYRATHVPVGEDQVQHLELARDIAGVFNRLHRQNFFPRPECILTPTKRLLSLTDPTQKMSKSAADKSSVIFLNDSDKAIETRFRRAKTDNEPMLSIDRQNRPGVSNLLAILSCVDPSNRTPEEWADELNLRAESLNAKSDSAKTSTAYVLKQNLTEATIEMLRPIRREIEHLQNDPGHLESVERMGRDKARQRAAETMQKVRQMCGLTPS